MTTARALEKKITGKPDVGKLLVRFDEGLGGRSLPPGYSTVLNNNSA